MYGYHGIVALINLNNRKIETVSIEEKIYKKFIGGSGVGTYLLMKYCPPDIEPLDSNNPLIYMTGPYTATGVPTSGRHHIVSKSPLTGIYCESDAGGTFGTKLKRAGYDGLVILGRAEKPVYIMIDNGEISFNDASDIWGLDTFACEERLIKEGDKKASISCIGPSGEMLIPIAGIFHDGMASRAAARGGLGAVMGSKNLKAIVVKGNKRVKLYNKARLDSIIKEISIQLRQAGAGMRNYGTAGTIINAEKFGDLPIKNWNMGSWVKEAQDISGEKMSDTILERNYGCTACPIRCGRIVKIDNALGGGPEYETLALMGSLCLIHDLELIAKAADICNRYGIDTMSTGSIIAFAMELYAEGIVSDKDSGRSMRWGSADDFIGLVKEIASKEGFGEILGKGVKKAAEIIGNGAEKYAFHVKGLEIPGHDPRCFKGMAVGYATANRGACHLSSFTYPWERSASMPELGYDKPHDRKLDQGKGEMTAKFQDLMTMVDSLKICKFALSSGVVTISTLVEMLNCITGWEFTNDDFLHTGARITALKRIYNISLGIDRKDDTLPERFLKQKRGSGGSADELPDLEMQLDEYYKCKGWDNKGVPKKETLESHDLLDL